jgi:hypothetical protein
MLSCPVAYGAPIGHNWCLDQRSQRYTVPQPGREPGGMVPVQSLGY